MPRGRADLRNHGAAYRRSGWRPAGYALLGRARCVTVERNGPDVLADECLPFGALAEADLGPTKSRIGQRRETMTDHKTGTGEEWLAAGGLKKAKFIYAKASPVALIDSFSEPRSSWLQ